MGRLSRVISLKEPTLCMDETQEAILERVRSLNTWKRGGERAPHKPLLLLLSLSRITQSLPRLI